MLKQPAMGKTGRHADTDANELVRAIKGAESFVFLQLDEASSAAIPKSVRIADALESRSKRGVKVRIISRITDANVGACSEILGWAELRHSEDVTVNLAITEKAVLIGFKIGARQGADLISSRSKGEVKLQEALFYTMWNQAITFKARIGDLVEGRSPSPRRRAKNRDEAKVLLRGSISAAKEEILALLSGVDGLDWLLTSYPRRGGPSPRGAFPSARVLATDVPREGEGLAAIKELLPGATIRMLDNPMGLRFSVAVFDRRNVVLLQGDDEGHGAASGPRAISFEDGLVASSFAAMFEGIWRESEMYKELAESDRVQRDFIDVAAHELKAPIQAILGYADLARGGDERDVSLNVDRILANTERLRRLVQNLLDVTRIESRTLRLNLEEFDLAEAVESGMASQEVTLKAKGLKLIFRRGRGGSVVRADRERLVQVISNLLDNAARFSPTGGAVVITTGLQQSRERGVEAVVRVEDHGDGVPPEFVPKLFTKFASRSARGTGLGLYICKSIVESHFGRIWHEDVRDGRGAVFAFALPLASGVSR